MIDLPKAKELATKLKHSSMFSAGDNGSFSLPFIKNEFELPGKYSPSTYLESLQVKDLGDVAVFFAGNGGLCVEALNRDANSVCAVEPRLQYSKAIKEVSLITGLASNKTFSVESTWLNAEPKFDTIIWSEGFDQLGNPIETLGSVYSSLREGGKLLLEVAHGEHKMPEGLINSWRPQEKVFVEALNKACPKAIVRSMRGRLERRTIYEILKPSSSVEQVKQEVVEASVVAPNKSIKKVNLKRKKS